ncbi:hypothetical protein GPALN_002212 [Globodera pallida]|nr:hypothetical protein GPALN_002212 [Globodera pallida]
MKKAVEQKRLSRAVEVHTVDSYQAKEADIVVMVTTRTESASAGQSTGPRVTDFFQDSRRATVALSRARAGMVVIANAAPNRQAAVLHVYEKQMSICVVAVRHSSKRAKCVSACATRPSERRRRPVCTRTWLRSVTLKQCQQHLKMHMNNSTERQLGVMVVNEGRDQRRRRLGRAKSLPPKSDVPTVATEIEQLRVDKWGTGPWQRTTSTLRLGEQRQRGDGRDGRGARSIGGSGDLTGNSPGHHQQQHYQLHFHQQQHYQLHFHQQQHYQQQHHHLQH